MHPAKACTLLLLLASLVSSATAQGSFNGNYLYTPISGAQTQVDVKHTTTWTLQISGSISFSGAQLTMKAGTATTANATFTVYNGTSSTGPIVCQVTNSRLNFTTQFQLITFPCPGAPLTLRAGSYYATLTSPAPDTQSTAYFIKGYSSSIVAAGPRDPVPGTTTTTASGLNLLKVAPTTSVLSATQVYAIYIGNSGPNDVAGGTRLSLIDQLPTGVKATNCVGTGLSSVVCSPYNVLSALLTCNATLVNTLVGTGTGTDPIDGPSINCTVTMPATTGDITNWASIDPAGGTAFPGLVNCTLPGCASATTTMQAAPGPRLTVFKSAPRTVLIGGQLDYTVSIGNVGTAALDAGTTFTVMDQLWSGSTLVGASPGPGITSVTCVNQPPPTGLLNCTVKLGATALAAGTTAINGYNFTITATAPNEQIGGFANYVSVSSNGVTAPPTPGADCVNSGDPGCASVGTRILYPDIELAKDAPDPVVASTNFNYTFNLFNVGTADLASGTVVLLNEQLPAGTSVVSTTAGAGVSAVACNGTTGLITCNVTLSGALAANTTAPFGPEFVLTVKAPVATGLTINYASVAADGVSTPPTPDANCTDLNCASAFTSVTGPNLVLAKSAPDPVLVDTDFNYTLNLGNVGTADVASGTVVQVAEQLPAGTSLVSTTAGTGVSAVACTGTTGLVTCNVTLNGAVVANTSTANGPVFTLTVTAPSAPGTAINYASVAPDGTSTPPTPGANCTDPGCASASTTVAAPALVLSKDAPNQVEPGATFNYTIRLGNTGTADVANGTVVLVDELLPTGVTLVSRAAGPGVSAVACTGTTGAVSCNVTLDGALVAGTSAATGPEFILTVTAPSTTGTTTNYVSVAPDGTSTPPTPGANCTDPGCASHSTAVTSVSLAMTKAAPDPVVAGTDFNYTLNLGNVGTADMADGTVVFVGERLPTGATLVSATEGTGVSAVLCDGTRGLVTCNVTLDGALPSGTVPANGAEFILTVTAPSVDGTSVNYVAVAPDGTAPPPTPGPLCTDPGCASASTTVTSPALVLAKSAPDPVVAGTDFNYTLNLGNVGTADMADGTVVLVGEQLPAGATLVSSIAGAGVSDVQCGGTTGALTCNVTLDGALVNGTAAADGPEFILTVTAPSTDGTTVNYVSVASDGVSPPPMPGANCTDPGCASASTTVTSPALILTKSAPDPVVADTDFNYTLNVGNTGTANVASGTVVLVGEQLPAGSTLVSTTAGAGVSAVQCDGTTGLVTCNVTLNGALAANTSAADGPEFILTVTAPPTDGITVNYVSVAPDGTSPPPAPGANCTDPGCASASTTVTSPALILTKSAPDPVGASTDFNYTLNLGNAGTADVANRTVVLVGERLPTGATLVSATEGAGVSAVQCDGTTGLVTCNVTLDGALASGTAAADGPEFILTVTAPPTDGITVNYVSVAPDGTSPPPAPGANCTDPGCASASTTVTSPALILTKSAPDPVGASTDFNYTLNLGNAGTADVANRTVVLVGERLPTGATLVSATEGAGVSAVQCDGTTGLVTCNVTLDGALASGTAAADGPEFILTVTAPPTDGITVNYVSVAPDGTSPPPAPGANCTDPGCASASTTVTSTALILTKSAPDPVVADTDFNYTLNLGNVGTAGVPDGTVVLVGERLPTGATLVSATEGAGVSAVQCDGTTGLVTCNVTLDGVLAGGTTAADGPEFILTVKAPSTDGTTVNYASVAADGTSRPPTPGPSCTGPRCASASTNVTGTAVTALILAKSAPGTVSPGARFNYTLNLGNAGTADVANGTVVLVRERLPTGVTLVYVTAGAGMSSVQCGGSSSLLTCSVTLDGALTGGTAASDGPEFTLTVKAPTIAGPTVNYASVATDGTSLPPTPGPNCTDPGCASAATTVTSLGVVVGKTGPGTIEAGKDFDYTIRLGNTGTADLAAGTVVKVGELLPTGVALVSATGGAGVSRVRCNGRTGLLTCSVTLDQALQAGTALADGPVVTLTVRAPADGGSVVNYVSVASDGVSNPPRPGPGCTDPGCASEATTVTAPSLVLTKTAPSTVEHGAEFVYALNLANAGTADVANGTVIYVAEHLPPGATLVAASPGSGVLDVECNGTTGFVMCAVTLDRALAAGNAAPNTRALGVAGTAAPNNNTAAKHVPGGGKEARQGSKGTPSGKKEARGRGKGKSSGKKKARGRSVSTSSGKEARSRGAWWRRVVAAAVP